MKYLRMTMWLGRKANPMTSIICERDLTVPIYTAANEQRVLSAAMMGPPLEVEVHELPEGLSLPEATMRIIQSRPEPLSKEEHHKHTLFDWAMDLLEKLNPGGTAQTTEPCPLDITTLTQILYRIAASPKYRDQTFNMLMPDGTEVSLVSGEVKTSKPN